MNESSWNECIRTNTSLKVSIDIGRAKSLIETAHQRIIFNEKNNASKDELKFVFEGYYTSTIEIIHAILSVKGYKVLNHICAGFYIKDILQKERLYKEFNRLRIKRNNMIYYGKEIDHEIIKEDIQSIKKLIKELDKIYSELK